MIANALTNRSGREDNRLIGWQGLPLRWQQREPAPVAPERWRM
jgi:hypothetical protein